ncbi:UDP-glucose dehydrogenase family protein [Nocardioides sp. BYT-33-1]|uniref:UDP-glucose dehydrogenase family protein n=1 Tax=Nocardioides sp. BYT-33-1 TaxID=3416952 RepID=UPI003F529910
MRVAVLGTGYLGATHAACLAEAGHEVVGIDRDAERIASLAGGRAPFLEEGLEESLRAGRGSGLLRFSTELADAAGAEVHFVCVGTSGHPADTRSGGIDVSVLEDLVTSLARLLDRPALVVGRSTVPVGTARRIRDLLRSKAPAGDAVALAWNPEFLREGHAMADSRAPHRLVVGTVDGEGLATLREVYADWIRRDVPFLTTDLETAELAKLAANAMLAVRVSTVNVLGEICEAAHADVASLTEIVGQDPRIGRDYLAPGPGYGGSCLPKDLRGLLADARDLGLDVAADFLGGADRVNRWQRERTVRLAEDLLGGAGGHRVTVLGTAFKAGSDDVRDSPALDIAAQLGEHGATVVGYDPVAPAAGLASAASAAEACRDADLVLVLTDWQEFAELDPVALGTLVRHRRVVDPRRCLDRSRWESAGWTVCA